MHMWDENEENHRFCVTIGKLWRVLVMKVDFYFKIEQYVCSFIFLDTFLGDKSKAWNTKPDNVRQITP